MFEMTIYTAGTSQYADAVSEVAGVAEVPVPVPFLAL